MFLDKSILFIVGYCLASAILSANLFNGELGPPNNPIFQMDVILFSLLIEWEV